MGVLSEINSLVKKAQLIVPPVYRPDVYRKGADNIARGANAVVDSLIRAAMTVPGAL